MVLVHEFASVAIAIAFGALPMAYANSAADLGQKVSVGSFLYVNAERTYFFAVRDGHSEIGPIGPEKPLSSQNAFQVDSSLGDYAFDCSNINYRCVKTSRIVLAVPRKKLSPKATYEIAGTAFSVVECLRGMGDACEVAMIKGDCEEIKDAETCTQYPGGRARAPRPGPVTYFIYNEDVGVTSVGFPDEAPKDEAWIAKLARDYVLRGDVGLLKR